MPLGVSRLLLATSAIRRVFGVTAVEATALDPLITQDGRFFSLNQSPDDILYINQDFDTQGNIFLTQDGRILQTQDNRTILTQRES